MTTEPTVLKPRKPKAAQDVTVIAAMARDAEWLCADACAFLLGMTTPDGAINRRGFLERVACRPSFPDPLTIGAERKWRRSEVIRWSEDERRVAA